MQHYFQNSTELRQLIFNWLCWLRFNDSTADNYFILLTLRHCVSFRGRAKVHESAPEIHVGRAAKSISQRHLCQPRSPSLLATPFHFIHICAKRTIGWGIWKTGDNRRWQSARGEGWEGEQRRKRWREWLWQPFGCACHLQERNNRK